MRRPSAKAAVVVLAPTAVVPALAVYLGAMDYRPPYAAAVVAYYAAAATIATVIARRNSATPQDAPPTSYPQDAAAS